MLKTALIVVHQDTSDSGQVGQALSARGYTLDQRCPAVGDRLPMTPTAIAAYDAIVVFGGPMSANDDITLPFIRAEMALIDGAIHSHRPFLGICLGAQMLARVLGSQVAPHPDGIREIGYYPITPTPLGNAWIPQTMYVYQWHQEGFQLPANSTRLATSETFPNQAFRYKSAYGLQFHPEITSPMIATWTTQAADHLTCPGAKPKASHFDDHHRYGPLVAQWLDRFMDQWLCLAP